MEMLKSSKDFRAQILWVVSQFSQYGIDPRKHARSRPMGLNVRWLSHGAFLVRLNEGAACCSHLKVPKCVASGASISLPSREIAEDQLPVAFKNTQASFQNLQHRPC